MFIFAPETKWSMFKTVNLTNRQLFRYVANILKNLGIQK